MTRKLSGGAVTIAAPPQSTDGISDGGVKDALFRAVEEGYVWPGLAMTKAAKRGSSDSKLMRVSSYGKPSSPEAYASGDNHINSSGFQFQFSQEWPVGKDGLDPDPDSSRNNKYYYHSDSNGAVCGRTSRSGSRFSALYNNSSSTRSSSSRMDKTTAVACTSTFTSVDEKQLSSCGAHSCNSTSNNDDDVNGTSVDTAVGGKVNMSVEDDMLSLSTRHHLTTLFDHVSNGIGARSWNGMGGGAVPTAGTTNAAAAVDGSASSLARRNSFVMR